MFFHKRSKVVRGNPYEGSSVEKEVADEKESNMDAGQSDFTDPPAIRQICYWILARYQRLPKSRLMSAGVVIRIRCSSQMESSEREEEAGHLFNTGLVTLNAVTCLYIRNLLFKA